MEDWRDLAGTVPGTLMLVADGATGLLETVRTAHRKLAACARVLRILEMGGAINADDLQEAPSARASLDDARRELARLLELHGRARRAFDLYDVLLGLGDEPRWRRWERHSGETSRHARHALRGLRSATTHLLGARHLSKLATTRSHRTREVSVHPCRSRVSKFMSRRHELAPRVDVMSALDTASLCFLRGDVSCY